MKSSSPSWAPHSCADLGITPEPREDHASYLAHWLEILREDKRAIFSAAAHAQRAVDFLHGLSAGVEETPEPAVAAAGRAVKAPGEQPPITGGGGGSSSSP